MNKSMRFSNKLGFTIIELLIVIVVIAILTAISVVAYNGIQQRAENGKTIAAANQLVKLLSLYKETYGNYPATTSTYACVGSGYTSGICHIAPDGTTTSGNEQSAFNTALLNIGSIPQPSIKRYTSTSTSQSVAGISFENSSKMIRYHLAGTGQECKAGGTGPFSYDTFTQCRIVLP